MHIPWIRVGASPTKKQILNDWRHLLADTTQKEEGYQRFIHEHAGFCFSGVTGREELVFSKLRLGADHTIDFGIASSQRSYGFVYTLIEIESPHDCAFTKGGDPSARLNHALQQIRDWKAWLDQNREESRRLFPSKLHALTGEQHFEYRVLIGRRCDDSSKFTHKRNQMADENGIAIRSFDWITDNIEHAKPGSFKSYSTGVSGLHIDEDNQFSNPFYHAYSDGEWRRFVYDKNLSLSHMIGNNVALLQQLRGYNKPRLEHFLAYVKTLPMEQREPPDFEYEMTEIPLTKRANQNAGGATEEMGLPHSERIRSPRKAS